MSWNSMGHESVTGTFCGEKDEKILREHKGDADHRMRHGYVVGK